ncbi:LPXTG-motif cell wall anchor domain-containing protein [Arcanobacterium phocae]|uniref:LPXTG-motif cell wall anchor domain-containing protein n=1 Tax=Arcanobacterium phocae TaxID=131112 RepID=A0A1H2LA29_9ACTO|nr:SpaH/EbpB family LPXTG-anchored major pilin [Arcanobacterium phocae]SDU77863.1 LPXTG-motif cell wall anchor domain-containing protein [Arcanobacterium phocae]
MKKHGKMRKRLVAFALGTTLLASVGTSVAFADIDDVKPAAGNIDTTQKGSITIHKLQNPDNGMNGNGAENTGLANKGIPGVTFTYQKVQDIDLTKNEGWTKVKDLKIDGDGSVKSQDGATTYDLDGAKTTGATDKQGMISASGLGLGVYLVKEATVPSNVVAKAAPFLVTVPFPSKTQGWLYDVHVYPKNTVLKPTDKPVKQVQNAGEIHFPGDVISWVIDQKVPQLGSKDKITKFVIEDQLPEGVDKPVDGGVTVTVKHANGSGAETVKYTKDISESKLVTITFDVNTLTAGDQITVDIVTKISENITGSLTNQSHTKVKVGDEPEKDFPSSPTPGTDNDEPDKETPKTETKFAELKITKKNKDDQLLNKAEFEVLAGTCATVSEQTSKRSLTTGAKPAHTTQANGVAAIMVTPGAYCVKETAAPVGYEIDPTYTQGMDVNVVENDGATLDVVNLRANDEGGSALPKLPLTGAAGFILLTFAGVAIVATAVGTGFVAVGRKKREQEA